MNKQTMIEATAHALIYGTGFIKVTPGPEVVEWSVVNPEDCWSLSVPPPPPPPPEAQSEAEKTAYAFGWWKAMESAREAQDRLYDLLLADDGQAWKEAERYLERARPDLIDKLKGKK